MKKVLYTMALIAMGLTSCTSFDNETAQDFGAGPAVNLSLAEKSDSSFTISIAPDAEAEYFAFVIDESATVDASVSASSLIAGNYGGYVLTTEKYPKLTLPVSAEPNTSYVVYAVANNGFGVLGEIETLIVKTTDSVNPSVQQFSNKDNQIAVLFDNAVTRGEGKITAFYLKEWDLENPVNLEDVEVTIDANGIATFKFPSAPAGAYVFLNWEKGAFVDGVGNPCPAVSSSLDLETGDFKGLWYHQANVTWNITSNEFSPASGELITDAAAFVGTIKFDRDVYVIEDDLEDSDIKVTYTSSGRTVTYNLPVSKWSVKDSTLTFSLPDAGMPGDVVTVEIAEGTVYDVLGNGNAAFADNKLNWTIFAPTKDYVLGNFQFLYTSAYDSEPAVYDGGQISIAEDPEVENGLIIKDLYLEGSVTNARYDLAKGKLYIEPYNALGLYTNSKGTTYGLVLYSISYADEIECTINADGTITTEDLGIVAFDENYESPLGWWEQCAIAVFAPAKEAAKAKASVKAAKANAVKAAQIPNKIVR